MEGWVKLHRQLFDNDLWFSEPFTRAQAWIDLFANANHCEKTINIRGNIVKIERGQIGWSELTMCKRWKWSKGKVRRFLKILETEQQIIQQKDRYITTIITILNYNKYQQTEQQTVQQKDSRRYITKNDNNEKKINASPKEEERRNADGSNISKFPPTFIVEKRKALEAAKQYE